MSFELSHLISPRRENTFPKNSDIIRSLNFDTQKKSAKPIEEEEEEKKDNNITSEKDTSINKADSNQEVKNNESQDEFYKIFENTTENKNQANQTEFQGLSLKQALENIPVGKFNLDNYTSTGAQENKSDNNEENNKTDIPTTHEDNQDIPMQFDETETIESKKLDTSHLIHDSEKEDKYSTNLDAKPVMEKISPEDIKEKNESEELPHFLQEKADDYTFVPDKIDEIKSKELDLGHSKSSNMPQTIEWNHEDVDTNSHFKHIEGSEKPTINSLPPKEELDIQDAASDSTMAITSHEESILHHLPH